MFITKESDYAVRMIRVLSRRGRGTVQSVCEEEQVPHQYGYKILKKLEKVGIVRSHRGTNGGYALIKTPGDISLYDVISAVEDTPLVTGCLEHGFNCPMNRGKRKCGVHREFGRIQSVILSALKEKTLEEIFAL
ncbi:MAG: Rrf2 family transcriptional regulator [Spirochaetales bacterium]|jgi:Rrf2 family protein|nr:Rrf2 family transcriptional regulator [Spirochaetales bacterium]